MPALSLSIDGVPTATVCTDGYDVAAINVCGTKIDNDLANLDLSAGSYPEQGEPTNLSWVCGLSLKTGQTIDVSFVKNAPTSHRGKAIEELFPDEPPVTQTDFMPTAEMFAELRTRPMLRDKFSFRLAFSSGTVVAAETAPDEHGFGFTVLWNSFHPERVRVSLHSYTLDSLETQGPMNYHIEEQMKYGDSVSFELVA